MKFGVWGQLTNVITCVKFVVDRFRGYGVLTPPELLFPIDLLHLPYNSVAMRHWYHTTSHLNTEPVATIFWRCSFCLAMLEKIWIDTRCSACRLSLTVKKHSQCQGISSSSLHRNERSASSATTLVRERLGMICSNMHAIDTLKMDNNGQEI